MTTFRNRLTALSTYFSSAQSRRDGLCLGLLVLAAGIWAWRIRDFIQEVPWPMLLIIGFGMSFVGALGYEFNKTDLRGSLVRMTAMAIAFMCASFLAPYARQGYFLMMHYLSTNPRTPEILGPEALNLGKNHLVGFGSSFAVSVGLLRVTCHWFFVRVLNRLVKHTPPVPRCPQCHEVLPH